MKIFTNWFKKKKHPPAERVVVPDTYDEIEECLWEIKDEYDLPTEEVDIMVESKRKNIEHMHEMLLKNKE